MRRFRILPRPHLAAMTLLEIMVVVVIMGMLATIVTKVVVDKVQQARVTTAKIQIAEIRGAVNDFYLAHSFYPEELGELVTRPESVDASKWPPNGYLESLPPKDPWGKDYVYIAPAPDRPFEIISYGRDGADGGEGFDADIYSWNLAGTEGDG